MEANFLVVKAYEFTTITSVTLLDCFTVPCVVVLSAIFLGPCFATFAPSQSTGVRCAEFQRAAFPMLALAGFVRTGVRYKALHGVGIIACVLGTSPPAATCNRHAVAACCYTRRCRFRQYTPTIRPKNGSRAALIEPCLPSALRSFVSGLRCGGAGLVLIVLSDLSRAPPDTDAPANVHRPAAVPAKAMQNDAL